MCRGQPARDRISCRPRPGPAPAAPAPPPPRPGPAGESRAPRANGSKNCYKCNLCTCLLLPAACCCKACFAARRVLPARACAHRGVRVGEATGRIGVYNPGSFMRTASLAPKAVLRAWCFFHAYFTNEEIEARRGGNDLLNNSANSGAPILAVAALGAGSFQS